MIAGIDTRRLSFIFMRTKTPSNISIVNPPDDIIKMGFSLIPIGRPRAPKISRIAVIEPNFSRPNRLNSIFIFVVVKYEIP